MYRHSIHAAVKCTYPLGVKSYYGSITVPYVNEATDRITDNCTKISRKKSNDMVRTIIIFIN